MIIQQNDEDEQNRKPKIRWKKLIEKEKNEETKEINIGINRYILMNIYVGYNAIEFGNWRIGGVGVLTVESLRRLF